MMIGSLNAAAICSSVIAAPGIASSSPAFVRCRFVVIWLRMKLRRWAILLSRGTARTHFAASLGSSGCTGVASLADFWSTAFLRRSNAVGDWGMPARIAAWAIVSLLEVGHPEVVEGGRRDAVALVAVVVLVEVVDHDLALAFQAGELLGQRGSTG